MSRTNTPSDIFNHCRLIVLGDADRSRLNDFVALSPFAHYKQLYEWGEILEYEGTRSVRLGVERDGCLHAALTLYIRKIPGTKFTIINGSRGPILDFEDTEALSCLLSSVKEIAAREHAIFLRIDPEADDRNDQVAEGLLSIGFIHLREKNWSDLNDPRVVMTMDLRADETELFKQLRETHRRHIRTIAKKGIGIREARDSGDVLRFREIMTEVGEKRGFPVRGEAYYARLWTHLIQTGRGKLFLAEKEGEPVAGILAIAVGRKAWLLYTGLLAKARGIHPNEAIWWEALRWAKQQRVASFNFGGSGTDWPPQADSPGYSIYAFKRGFGAKGVYLTGYYDLVFIPSLYRFFRFAEERFLPRAVGAYKFFEKLINGRNGKTATT